MHATLTIAFAETFQPGSEEVFPRIAIVLKARVLVSVIIHSAGLISVLRKKIGSSMNNSANAIGGRAP